VVWFSQYTFKHLPKFGEVKDQLPKDLVLLNLKIFSKVINVMVVL
jgi:UMF1 family MFS transporter